MAEMAATKKLEDERRENLKLQREIQHLNIEVDKKHRALIDQSKGLRVCVHYWLIRNYSRHVVNAHSFALNPRQKSRPRHNACHLIYCLAH